MKQLHAVLITVSGWSMVRHRREQILGLLEQGWKVSAVSSFTEEQENELRAMGADTYAISCEGTGTNPAKLLAYYHRIGKLLTTLRPDIVHNFSTKPIIIATLASKMVNVRNVVCTFPGMGIVGTDRYVWTHGILKHLFRYALRGRTITVFQNTQNMKELVDAGIVRRHRAAVIPGCGVDVDAIETNPYPPARPRFVMVSRMMWSKGVREFVNAARAVKSTHPETEFLLVGPADVNYAMQDSDYVGAAWLRALDNTSARWIGRVPPAKAEELIRESTAVVLLSTAQEGIPRVLIEAAASGTPVITNNWPGCRDVVDDNVSGFLCRPECAEEDAIHAMLRLIDDHVLSTRMRWQGPVVAKRFDKSIVIDATLQVYERAMQ